MGLIRSTTDVRLLRRISSPHPRSATGCAADDVGVPRGLRDLGVTEADVRKMAHTTLDDACLSTNPRAADESDVTRLFLEAM